MAKTSIEWADYTFNPWIGCTKVSPACDNCYAANYGNRFGVEWGAGKPRKITSDSNWKQPLRWNLQAEIKFDAWEGFKKKYPALTDEQLIEQGFVKPKHPRVFCASLADVFDNEVPQTWRDVLFELIIDTPYLDWLILTKRIGNASKMIDTSVGVNINGYTGSTIENGLIHIPNVWLGITVCNQEEADRDIPKLLQIPATKRFLSIEPMLGEIDISAYLHNLDWVICGGESGKNARPMHPDWVRTLREQCEEARVPFLFKQWGEWTPYITNETNLDKQTLWIPYKSSYKFGDHLFMVKTGKKQSGRLLDGREHNEFPNE